MKAKGASEPLVLEKRIRARPETVFSYFVDPKRMVRWMGVSAELEPRPGGLFRVNVTGRDVAGGTYLEVTPNTRVVFTWGWEGEGREVGPGESTVEVSLTSDGDGTLVRVRHLGLAGEQRAGHAEGWEHYFGRLTVVAAGGDPGPDSWAEPDEGGDG